MTYEHVNAVVSVLDSYLDGYLTAYSTSDIVLKKPAFYKYEKNVYDKLPAMVVFATASNVVGMEVGAEIIESDISGYLTDSGDERKLALKLYLYERAVRECIGDHRLYNGVVIRCDSVEYFFAREAGTKIYKTMRFRFLAQKEYNYS